VISILKKEVHESFYGIDCIKKGVIYIHGKLPDLIKEYLEYKFKTVSEFSVVVANNVIIEGINLPIDTLFILSTYKLHGKQLTNLIGRVNRLNDVFRGNKNKLSMLLPKVHFVNNTDHNNSNDMFNKIILLRSRLFLDEIKNPLLAEFDIEKIKDSNENLQNEKRNKIRQIQKNEEFLYSVPKDLESRLKQYFIEYGVDTYYKDLDSLVKDVLLFFESKKSKSEEWKGLNLLNKMKDIFLKNDNNLKDYELRRLQKDSTINYYSYFIEISRKKPLNENINNLVAHFKEKAQSSIDKERKFYFGTSYGEEAYSSDSYINPKYNTYVDVGKVENDKRLVNLAIVKLKMEEEFVSFTLNKFIIFLYDFELITSEEYNLHIYGTNDKTKIKLTKFGLNINFIVRLEEDSQLENLVLDKNNNLTANLEFQKYVNTLDDFHSFEINRFLN